MDLPRTREEALAQGYTQIDDIDAILARHSDAKAHEYLGHGDDDRADAGATVDCGDPANAGRRCQVLYDGGQIIVFFCQGGACSRASALAAQIE